MPTLGTEVHEPLPMYREGYAWDVAASASISDAMMREAIVEFDLRAYSGSCLPSP